MVLDNSMRQVDSLYKHQEDKSDQLGGVKCACWDLTDEYDKYMDGLDNQIHDTQSQGAPLQRDSLATMTRGRRVSRTSD
eukprot:13487503-Ditylum_brightwellii.AAC.1